MCYSHHLFSTPDRFSWGMWSDGELLPICEIRWAGVCCSKPSWQAYQSEPVSNMFGTTCFRWFSSWDQTGSEQWEEQYKADQGRSQALVAPQRCGLTSAFHVGLFQFSCLASPMRATCGSHPRRYSRQKASDFTLVGLVKDGRLGDNDETVILKALTPVQAPACLTRS